METLDYDKTHWNTRCPKVDCKKKCCCGLAYVFVPTALENTIVPEKGAYHDAVVEYESTGAIYIYSSEGIPVLVTSSDPGELEREIRVVAERLARETATRAEADESLAQAISAKQDAITQSDKLDADLVSDAASTNKFATAEELSKISTALQPDDIDRTVMDDLNVNSNPSTSLVQLDAAKVNLKTGATSSKSVPFPVASTTQAGVMNSATFNAVTSNTDNINALLNGAVAVDNLSATPTQAELTTAWQGATGLTTLINRAQIYDSTNSKIWTYYTNSSTWYESPAGGTVSINTFTNQSEGVILGSTNIGQIFAENDGTGSVNGWDALSSAVSDNTNNKLASANLTTSGGITKTTTGSGSATTVELSIADGDIVASKLDKTSLVNLLYPVGSYYETSNTNFNPNTTWGGEWLEDTAGLVLVARDAGTFATIGDTGGEETHVLTVQEMPSHSHTEDIKSIANNSNPETHTTYWGNPIATGASGYRTTQNTGGGSSHNNLQPYIVVKRWHRVA